VRTNDKKGDTLYRAASPVFPALRLYAGRDKEYYRFCGTEGAVYFRLDGTTGDFLKSYKTVYPFADGAALVFDGEEYFYVNRSGGKMFS